LGTSFIKSLGRRIVQLIRVSEQSCANLSPLNRHEEDEEGPISVHTEDKQLEPFTSHDEPPPSSALEFTMYLQMTLIVILALFRLFGCIEMNH
jgi:hypothetical protein